MCSKECQGWAGMPCSLAAEAESKGDGGENEWRRRCRRRRERRQEGEHCDFLRVIRVEPACRRRRGGWRASTKAEARRRQEEVYIPDAAAAVQACFCPATVAARMWQVLPACCRAKAPADPEFSERGNMHHGALVADACEVASNACRLPLQ